MDFSDKEILIVDDDHSIRKKLEVILSKSGLKSNSFDSGELAIEELKSNYNRYDMILLDVTMGGLSGFETAKMIKESPDLVEIPIIFITGNYEPKDKKMGFEVGCVDYITKPFDNNEVVTRVKLHLELFHRRKEALNYAIDLQKKVLERTSEIRLVRKALIISLSTLAETRDPETGAHILRTQEYSRELAIELSKLPQYQGVVDEIFVERMYDCAPLHDIGKVGIPDYILQKPAKLTEDEFKIMRRHSYIGYKTLLSAADLPVNSSFLKFAADIAYSHHEKYDGTGYPRGLVGENIPLQGRIMAISDVYDALISKRVYKEAWSHNEAVKYILNESGRHFDPKLIEIFEKIKDKFYDIKERFQDEEEEKYE